MKPLDCHRQYPPSWQERRLYVKASIVGPFLPLDSRWVVTVVVFMTHSKVPLHIVPLRCQLPQMKHKQIPFTVVKQNSASH